jgi:DNA (cytosine-5)-methyltransferase 1
MKTGAALTAIDLCSGPGGVTTGYKAAGIRVLAAVDIDEDARATYAANHSEVTLLSDDLGELNPAVLMEKASVKPRELDILTACVPCQTFSSLARERRERDPRNRLVLAVTRFVKALQPRAVVMENVPELRNNRRFALLVGRLRRLGYGVWFDVVDAADFGVPQRRRRLVLIALKGRGDDEVPGLARKHHLPRSLRRRRTVREVLRLVRLRAQRDALARPRVDYPPRVAKRIAAIPTNGGSRSSLTGKLRLKCHKKVGTRGATSSYGRMRYDDVAPTLTTRCVTPACGRFIHPRANRAITLREAACLQTFPLDYVFKGGTMAVQAQIGNAVPPRLAQAIGIVVAEALRPAASSSATESSQAGSGVQGRRLAGGTPRK